MTFRRTVDLLSRAACRSKHRLDIPVLNPRATVPPALNPVAPSQTTASQWREMLPPRPTTHLPGLLGRIRGSFGQGHGLNGHTLSHPAVAVPALHQSLFSEVSQLCTPCSFSSELPQLSPSLGTHVVHRSVSSEAAASRPVSSPLMQPLSVSERKGENAALNDTKVKATLARIKQGVHKVNLVAALVRGMHVEDALQQMTVSTKRAAKTVAKVIHAARANAGQNHGLNTEKLIVSEAFVTKDKYLKRVNPHGRGKSGVKERPRCKLTVLVREMSPSEEVERASVRRMRRSPWKGRLLKLMPHRLFQVGSAPKPQETSTAGASTA